MRYLEVHCMKYGGRKLNNFKSQGHTKKGFTYEVYIDEEDGANE